MTFRIRLLTVLLAFALALAGTALLLPEPNAVHTAGLTVLSVPEEGEEPLYRLQATDGELCIYQNGTLLRRTGVRVSTLPGKDRELLEQGIDAHSQEELASLLEDLCS
jgi:hypothetical protein